MFSLLFRSVLYLCNQKYLTSPNDATTGFLKPILYFMGFFLDGVRACQISKSYKKNPKNMKYFRQH